MALLQVRNFPDDVYNSLALLAKSEHRSIAQQTIVLVTTAVYSDNQKKKQRQELLKELLGAPPVLSGDHPSPAELIREDRDR